MAGIKLDEPGVIEALADEILTTEKDLLRQVLHRLDHHPHFIPARFIKTSGGDLIAPDHIASVRYWPGKPERRGFENRVIAGEDHRAQLETKKGAVWELYRGPSAEEAVAARDAMLAIIEAAISPPPDRTPA